MRAQCGISHNHRSFYEYNLPSLRTTLAFLPIALAIFALIFTRYVERTKLILPCLVSVSVESTVATLYVSTRQVWTYFSRLWVVKRLAEPQKLIKYLGVQPLIFGIYHREIFRLSAEYRETTASSNNHFRSLQLMRENIHIGVSITSFPSAVVAHHETFRKTD